MPETESRPAVQSPAYRRRCRVAVIWIDWYAYHVARFRGLDATPAFSGSAAGIELVGGIGVHAGLKFREELPVELPVETLMPEGSWQTASQVYLALRLWRHLSKLRPEILLVPGYYTLPAVAAAIWAKVHYSTSVLMTESTAHDHERVWWKEAAKSLLIRGLFDWAVSGGKAHVRYLRELHFPEDRIAGRYDVVDNDFFARATEAARERTPEDFGLPRRYFLYVGRLAPEKNVDGLLASWIAYRREGGAWPLVLAGDGPCAEALRELAASCSFAEDVVFAGHQSSQTLPAYYAFAGCFVLPSTREPWGLVVNEAMASGLPVLVSDRCGCAEDLVVPGHSGYLFDPLDRAGLASSMGLMERFSEAERSAMSSFCKEHIRRYSPRAFGREIARIQPISSDNRES